MMTTCLYLLILQNKKKTIPTSKFKFFRHRRYDTQVFFQILSRQVGRNDMLPKFSYSVLDLLRRDKVIVEALQFYAKQKHFYVVFRKKSFCSSFYFLLFLSVSQSPLCSSSTKLQPKSHVTGAFSIQVQCKPMYIYVNVGTT